MSPEHATIKRATRAAQKSVERLDAEALSELSKLYRQAAAEIAAAIERYAGADGNLMLTELQSVLAQVNGQIKQISYQRDALLGEALSQASSLGVEPMAAVLDTSAMMRVNETALSFVRNFVAADGLQLSDRIWRLDRQARDLVTNAIEMAVIQGHGAAQAAREFLARGQPVPIDLQDKISAAGAGKISRETTDALLTGSGSPMDNAMRLMRTEINRAHGTAYMMGANEHPDVVGYRYLLSPAHPEPDICDLLSTQNLYGLGEGVYPKDKINGVWPAHPNTLSFVVAVLKDEVTDADRAGKETPMQALARLTQAQRVGVLGVNKAKAYGEGKISQGMIKSPWKAVSQRIEKMEMKADKRDELTRQYFSGKGIQITGMTSDIDLGNGIVDKVTLPLLLGVLDNSRIHVNIRKNRIDFESRHALYDRPVTYMLDNGGVLHAVDFYLSPDAPEGIGTRMMGSTLLAASELGIREVQLKAAGKPDNGYYTWARLGFDGQLSDKIRQAAERSGFSGVKTVQDVFSRPGGREWWIENGVRMEMNFDLDRDSLSMKTLLNYLAEKGIRL